MFSYPSIDYFNKGILGSPIVAFDKLDGSNLRFEWSRKKGWCKFGTRNSIIDVSHEEFGEAVPLFLNKYGDDLERIFIKDKGLRDYRSLVAFAEWGGENSFAGYHCGDESKDIVLFDVATEGNILPPKTFIRLFHHLHIPDIIYEGNFNRELIGRVRNGDFRVKEGVVCKGVKRIKGEERVWMVKIKTLDWLTRLKGRLGDDALAEEVNGDLALLV